MHPSALDALNPDSWFFTLPLIARAELTDSARIRRFQSGHILYRKGDNDGHLYGVLSGRVKAGASTYSGSELMLTSMLPGDWFGEISILDGLGRTHDAVAVEETELVVVPKASIQRLCQQKTVVRQALVQLLCSHCRQAFSAIDEFLLFTPEQTLATRLLRMNRGEESLTPIRINQQELSSLVGISRQSINKILKKWERQDWIRIAYGSVTIVTEQALLMLIEN